jgi:hypothetical protein
MTESMFVQAVGLARSGRRIEARDLFQKVLTADRTNEMAWLWYAECLDSPAERRRALETCARLNPQAQRVRMSLTALINGNPPSRDLGLTVPVTIRDHEAKQEAVKQTVEEKGSLSQEDEWVLSAGSAVFTVPPERIAPDEFARIEERTEAFLLKNPDMKPIFRRNEGWLDPSSKPAAPFLDGMPVVQPVKRKARSHSARGAVFTLLLIALMVMLLASAAIILHAV